MKLLFMLVITSWALGKIGFGNICDPLKVVVTGVTEMGGAEAEEHSDGAAIAALVLEEVGAVFRAHLSSGHIRTGPTH